MIGTPFFGGHVVRWTPYFRGTSLTLPSELCSSVGFNKPWQQGEGVVTKQKKNSTNQALPPQGVQPSGGENPKVPSSIFFCNLQQLNISASDEDPLDPASIQLNLWSASTRDSSTREKKPLHL